MGKPLLAHLAVQTLIAVPRCHQVLDLRLLAYSLGRLRAHSPAGRLTNLLLPCVLLQTPHPVQALLVQSPAVWAGPGPGGQHLHHPIHPSDHLPQPPSLGLLPIRQGQPREAARADDNAVKIAGHET